MTGHNIYGSVYIYSLLENLSYDAFYHFPLFDQTLRHIELRNSVISHKQQNPPKLF